MFDDCHVFYTSRKSKKKVDPMNEQLVMQEAVQLKRAGRFDESRSLYHKVIKAIPQCDPAYNGLAKVEIGSQRYEMAIQALLMKIDLGILFTKRCPPSQVTFMRENAIRNLSQVTYGQELLLGGKVYPNGEVTRMCRTNPVASDIALLAWAEVDLFFYLGHCLVRMFPFAFASYGVPEVLMANLEQALRGHACGQDARDTRFASMFYATGFLLACANIKSVITSIDPSLLRERFNRQLDLLGLGSPACSPSSKKKSWFASLFG